MPFYTEREVWWMDRIAEVLAIVVLYLIGVMISVMIDASKTQEISLDPIYALPPPCVEHMRSPGREGREVIIIVCPEGVNLPMETIPHDH